MKKVLLLNGAKQFAHSDGRYNATLHQTALSFLDRAGFDVKETQIDAGYDLAEEVAKFLWADVIIYQMPGWWMGAPWTVKKYLDEVFTEGHGSLYANDGRTRSDASQKYGSGGLLQGKQYRFPRPGTHRSRPSTIRATSSKARASMRCISPSTRPTSSSA
jgi:modulator of drug activity B